MGFQRRLIADPDQHIQEPADFWTTRVPTKYRDEAPRVADFPLGGQCFIFDGGEYFWPLGLEVAGGKNYAEYSWHGNTFESIRPGCYDPKERLVDMSLDGIDVAALFPSVGMRMRSPKALKDPEFGLAMVRAYNQGIWEWCQDGDSSRLIPLAVIPGFGVESAVHELDWAIRKGFTAVFLSALPNGGDQPDPDEDAFWARCEETGVVVNIHQSLAHGDETGGMARADLWEPADALRLMSRAARNVVAGRSGVRIVKDLAALALTGVFERFPNLKVVSVETGVGWIPFFLEQLDDNWKRHRFWAHAPVLPMLPSEYIRRNVWATFQVDRTGVKARHDIGVDRMMWSTDYPHTGQDWPNSRWVMEMQLTDVPELEVRQLIGMNMAELYGLDLGRYLSAS